LWGTWDGTKTRVEMFFTLEFSRSVRWPKLSLPKTRRLRAVTAPRLMRMSCWLPSPSRISWSCSASVWVWRHPRRALRPSRPHLRRLRTRPIDIASLHSGDHPRVSDKLVPERMQQWLHELNHFTSEMQRLTSEIALLPPEAGEERMARLAQLADVMSECA